MRCGEFRSAGRGGSCGGSVLTCAHHLRTPCSWARPPWPQASGHTRRWKPSCARACLSACATSWQRTGGRRAAPCSACGAESARVPRARVPSASRMPRLPAPRPSRQGTSSSATSRTTSAPSRSARAAPVPAHTPLAAPPARRARGEHDHPRIPNRRLSALEPPSPALHAAARFYRHALLRTCAATSANVTQTNMRRLKLAPLQIFASSRLARPRRQRQRRHSTSCKTLPRPPPPSHLPSTSCRCAF